MPIMQGSDTCPAFRGTTCVRCCRVILQAAARYLGPRATAAGVGLVGAGGAALGVEVIGEDNAATAMKQLGSTNAAAAAEELGVAGVLKVCHTLPGGTVKEPAYGLGTEFATTGSVGGGRCPRSGSWCSQRNVTRRKCCRNWVLSCGLKTCDLVCWAQLGTMCLQ
jgi:hypothetical protein